MIRYERILNLSTPQLGFLGFQLVLANKDDFIIRWRDRQNTFPPVTSGAPILPG